VSTCPLVPRFFGLTPSDREAILEQHYFLVRRLGMTYTEAREMPIMYREWFINRFIRENEERSTTHARTANEAAASIDRAATIARAFNR